MKHKERMAGGGTVGVRELKNRLTHYLKAVQGGSRLVVTDRGKPVAVVMSVNSQTRNASIEERLAGLASEGGISLPADAKGFQPFKAVKAKGKPASRLVMEERR